MPPVAAHHKKAAVGVLFKALHRLLNNILVVGAREAAVRRHHKIGVCSQLGQIVRVAPVEVRALDLARVLEDLLDLRRDRVEKRARLGKVFFRPPHLGRGDEVHRVRHLLRALDARDVLADLLHARHVPVTSLFIWKIALHKFLCDLDDLRLLIVAELAGLLDGIAQRALRLAKVLQERGDKRVKLLWHDLLKTWFSPATSRMTCSYCL